MPGPLAGKDGVKYTTKPGVRAQVFWGRGAAGFSRQQRRCFARLRKRLHGAFFAYFRR
jgi:hypothetical protein